MSTAPNPPFADLIEASFEEAVFLWGRWETELHSLTRNLDEIWFWTEDRLHGALDGVRVAGVGLLEIAREGLASEEHNRVAVSMSLLGSSSEPAAVAALGSALADAKDDKLNAMLRGLEVAGSNDALRAATTILAAQGPAHQAGLCRLKAFRRAVPSQEMVAAFESNVPQLQIEALRAARHLDADYLYRWLAAGVQCAHPGARQAAIESGLRRGVPEAWKAAVQFAARMDADSGPYLTMLAMLGDEQAQEIIYTALRDPKLQREAIRALGHLGTRRAVEACLFGMQYEKLSRLAAEAYCCITGADLERDHLAATPTVTETPEFEADDLEADLVPQSEDTWPAPDAEAVRRHWHANQARYQDGVRYLRGRPLNTQSLVQAIEHGPMLRRPEWVLQLAAQSQGRYDVETRAFRARQHAMMLAARSSVAA